jgi:glycosyltransferase involved in cell wall biosynthesis
MAFVQYDLYRPTTLDSKVKQQSAGFYAFTETYLARSARMLVLSESQMLIDHLRVKAPGVRIFPNWPPTDSHYFSGGSRARGRELCKVGEKIPLIIYTGAISRLEGVDILITAIAEVVKRHPDCVLAIAGSVVGDILPGMPPDYHAMPMQLGIEKNVRFLGTVNKEAVRDLLAAADCLVMPKRDHEGNEAASPIKLGEYLASGRPVVASRVCGIDRWLSNRESVMLSTPGSPTDLAHAIDEVLGDPSKANEIGLRGQREGEQHCDFRQWGRAFLDTWSGQRESSSFTLQCASE